MTGSATAKAGERRQHTNTAKCSALELPNSPPRIQHFILTASPRFRLAYQSDQHTRFASLATKFLVTSPKLDGYPGGSDGTAYRYQPDVRSVPFCFRHQSFARPLTAR